MELPAELVCPPDRVFKVWPENWPAVEMFIRLSTQWRFGPRGPMGLDYGCARWLFELYPVPDPRGLLEDLQVMEDAVLQELRKT